jgi:uncharacterized protein (TIGR02391 family)
MNERAASLIGIPVGVFTHVRVEDDGTRNERDITVYKVGPDSLKVGLREDVLIGDVIEDRLDEHKVKRMEILDVIPERREGLLAAYTDHLELRYELRTRAEITPPKQFEVSSLHPDIAKLASPRIAAGHGNDAVLRAYEAIERRVQLLSSRSEIGKELMSKVFRSKEGACELDVAAADLDEDDRNHEREGYQFLFMGAIMAIRNSFAHGSRAEKAPTEIFELLAPASHLMRRLDLAEQRITP